MARVGSPFQMIAERIHLRPLTRDIHPTDYFSQVDPRRRLPRSNRDFALDPPDPFFSVRPLFSTLPTKGPWRRIPQLPAFPVSETPDGSKQTG